MLSRATPLFSLISFCCIYFAVAEDRLFLPLVPGTLQVIALRADAQQIAINEMKLNIIIEEYEEELEVNWRDNEWNWGQEAELEFLLDDSSGTENLKGLESGEKYLLPPPEYSGKIGYTLVLDMDETLLHYRSAFEGDQLYIRPYAEIFLKEMSKLYEIVIFTGGGKDYADPLLNILDPDKYIMYRLYRQDTTKDSSSSFRIKDLSRIGRDLSKTVMIDNTPQHFRLQADNGLEIASYYDDTDDVALLEFIPFLKSLVEQNVKDVRRPIKEYKKDRKYT